MKNKFYIAALAFLFGITSVYGQVNADIIRPSANAEQFGSSLKAETALSKGQLSLNIPLMTLKGKGYDLPISLMFYNGDVVFTTEASPVGLGWALMAGGVITKTIKGTDDTDTLFTSKVHQSDPNYIQNRYNDQTTHATFLDDILSDPMPDEYMYSLPGHSGTIEVSINGDTTEYTLFPDESYKIESTENGYCITADDGTKFYFETVESRVTGSWPETTTSTSWFLTNIVTNKGGVFTFNYADEEYVDLSTSDENEHYFDKYCTKRITSIVSDFGIVLFDAVIRNDRGSIGCQSITTGKESKRINRIELRDENNGFVKGYELDNSGLFRLYREWLEYQGSDWVNYRHKLSSIKQYDSADNYLPPYEFVYDYRFSKSKLAERSYQNNECKPRDSWTSCVGGQVYVDLSVSGDPLCSIGNQLNATPEGFVQQLENYASTAEDYFCLTRINYPTGETDEFTYEYHRYNKVNNTDESFSFDDKIQGRRLASKKRYGEELIQETDYVYQLHDSNYHANGPSSGVLTNPSIHCATYYNPETCNNGNLMFRASRISSGKAFNSFMGPPVCYTEVEEVEKDDNDTLSRTIHYFEPQIVSPPINYIIMCSPMSSSYLVQIENNIFGTKSGYTGNMSGHNNTNGTYLAYPVADFYNTAIVADQPLKEVFIGKDGDVRSIKNYSYTNEYDGNRVKYGYRAFRQNWLSYTVNWISVSNYITRPTRLDHITTTTYYYNENIRDSICEYYHVDYNKGRQSSTFYKRNNNNSNEIKLSENYYPNDMMNIVGNTSSSEIEAISGLIEKNIVADPIKTVVKRNGMIIGGECKDYQMLSGMPLLKSLYKIKNSNYNHSGAPTVNGDNIDYLVDLYKEGEIMTYDGNQNPAHVRLNDTQDRIYVWGYGGRFPIAVIDNMNHTAFQAATDLRSAIMQLETYKKIETGDACTSLRNLNATIRSLLPGDAHITTYTYDPYFGMTSETDDSNLGTIFTYDSFGRLTAKYDVNYKKLEEYNYHYKLQQ